MKMLHLNLNLTRERHNPDILYQPFHIVAAARDLLSCAKFRFHDILQPTYFATIVDTSAISPVHDAHHRAKWTDRARAPLVKIASSCFSEILDQIHATRYSVQLPILDPGLLLKGDDIVQDSSLCCFGAGFGAVWTWPPMRLIRSVSLE